MKSFTIYPVALSLALFATVPASTPAHAMSSGAGIMGSANPDDSLIVLAATPRKVSAAAMKACHGVKNRAARNKCIQEHGM